MTSTLDAQTYLTAAQLALYINRCSPLAARKWARRAGVPILHAGAFFLVRRKDVDDALAGRLRAARKGKAA